MHIHPAKHARVAILSISALGLAAASAAAAQAPAAPLKPGSVAPADVRLLSTKVADILAQFPANGSADRDKLADQMLGLGEAGLAEFAKQLVPAGAGNDTAVRFALNAVAAYASKSAEPKRALAERAFVAALGTATDVEVRTFVLRQLRLVGRDAAVKAATPLLADDNLVEPATQLMLTVKGLPARAALAARCRRRRGPRRSRS